MPYELTCPSCHAVTTSPFVRVGAVVICPRCQHKFRIADAQVKRRVAAANGSEASSQETASGPFTVEEEDGGTGEELVRRAADGRVIGLSGLSEMMQSEPSPATTRPMQAPPAGRSIITGETESVGVSGMSARHQALRRNSRALYVMFAGLGLVMAGIGVTLWWVMMSGQMHIELPPPGTPQNRSQSQAPPSPYDALPLVSANPMRIKPWRPVGDSYSPGLQTADAWLVDEARVFTGAAEELFTASVVSTSEEIVIDADLHVVLVAHDKPLIRTTMPVALFGADRRQRIRIPLPSDPSEALLTLDAWVVVHHRMVGGVYCTDVVIEPLVEGFDTQVLLAATNPTRESMRQMTFVITASDARERPQARWRIDLDRDVPPNQRIELRAALAGVPDAIAEWSVVAAGSTQPDGEDETAADVEAPATPDDASTNGAEGASNQPDQPSDGRSGDDRGPIDTQAATTTDPAPSPPSEDSVFDATP